MTMQLTELNASEKLAAIIIKEAYRIGVRDFCLCPGARNYQLSSQLAEDPRVNAIWCMDERSAAFFALGLSKKHRRPAAVITTSGTAVGEMLPAAMEAYYSGIPILLISADRPASYRRSGSPQTAEQVNIFGQYAPFQLDIEDERALLDLSEWNQNQPAHLNVCFDEPMDVSHPYINDHLSVGANLKPVTYSYDNWNVDLCKVFLKTKGYEPLTDFLHQTSYPFVVVSALKGEAKEAVAQFLLHLQAPVFLEATSGLREDNRLKSLRITRTDGLWKDSQNAHYPIDGILRIGGVPTFRLWRDLEEKQIPMFSVNDVPFTGNSFGTMAFAPVGAFFEGYENPKQYDLSLSSEWLNQDSLYNEHIQKLFRKYPKAEKSLFYYLSKVMPDNAQIFIGNSLPIREWDQGATSENKAFSVFASRGLNGIDGQISTYLGMLDQNRPNWGIFGDLTTLYDMNSFWYLPQLSKFKFHVVVVNNQGGKIFAGKFSNPAFQNNHVLSFEYLAKFWKIDYVCWTEIPSTLEGLPDRCLIELRPDAAESQIFGKELLAI